MKERKRERKKEKTKCMDGLKHTCCFGGNLLKNIPEIPRQPFFSTRFI